MTDLFNAKSHIWIFLFTKNTLTSKTCSWFFNLFMDIYFQESCTSAFASIVIFTQGYMFCNQQRRECLNPINSKKIIANHYLGLITVLKTQAKKNVFLNIEEFGQSWHQWLKSSSWAHSSKASFSHLELSQAGFKWGSSTFSVTLRNWISFTHVVGLDSYQILPERNHSWYY